MKEIRLPSMMEVLELQAVGQLARARIPVPLPEANEVLIRTATATICTSDLQDIRSNPFGIVLPRVLGHEGAGTVVRCGAAVRSLSPGMRVAAHPVVPCGMCVECRRGFSHLCLQMGHMGIDRDGTFAEYFVQRADRVIPLPDNVPFDLGALLEPVANCLQTIARAGNIKGRTVLVVGDGPFGNTIVRLAVRAGAGRVVVSGREPFRLGMMPDLELVEIVDVPPVQSVDVAILAVGSPEAVSTCLASLRNRGRLVVFSPTAAPVEIDLFGLLLSELEIVGCRNDEDRIHESLSCLQDSAIGLSRLITHRIPFGNWEEAFHLARDRHDKALKVALVFE